MLRDPLLMSRRPLRLTRRAQSHGISSGEEIGGDLETVRDVTGKTMAVTLNSWTYVQEAMGQALNLSCHFYQWAGTCWHRVPLMRKIREFGNLQENLALPARPLTKEKKANLRERGRSGADWLMGEGQVVIDVKSFWRCNPTHNQWRCVSYSRLVGLHLLPPSIHGFSLCTKRFGEFLISRLSPVTWRDNPSRISSSPHLTNE
ncbi:hypothetical protein NBRC10513_002546 [Rhodotorula toruloides]